MIIAKVYSLLPPKCKPTQPPPPCRLSTSDPDIWLPCWCYAVPTMRTLRRCYPVWMDFSEVRSRVDLPRLMSSFSLLS